MRGGFNNCFPEESPRLKALLASVHRLEPDVDYCGYKQAISIDLNGRERVVPVSSSEISRWRHAVAIGEVVEGLGAC